MPRNGSGGYSLPAGNPVVTGTTISSTDFNNTITDIGTAIAGSLSADGQTAWSGNQNANGNRLTSLGQPSSLADGVTASDVQTGRLNYLTAVAGTNTITAVLPMMAAYTAGEEFRLIAANTNTGAVTLNVNSLGALAITKNGTNALVAGDIRAGAVVTVAYDGTRFQLQTAGTGLLIGTQVISSTQTYTATPGTNSVVVELVGGGGGGGGCPLTGAGQIAAASGGGAGGYVKTRLTAGFSGVTVTIGAAGTGTAGLAGGNGGTTSFGAICSATGGAGGGVGVVVAAATVSVNAGAGAGGTGTGGTLVDTTGGSGENALFIGALGIGGAGGASAYGAGGQRTAGSGAGLAAASIGAAGSGASLGASSAAVAGGIGSSGTCIVWEYA